MNPNLASRALLRHLRERFAIDWHGYHGAAHWARVRLNGLALAGPTGANAHVVELSSFFHDACRVNEGRDAGHGQRGGELARALRGTYFEASDEEMELLVLACDGHSGGGIDADITVQDCWDADRLDLARVGTMPKAKYLCTEQARQQQVIDQAVQRSREWLAGRRRGGSGAGASSRR